VKRFFIPPTLLFIASACTPDIEENAAPDPNATIIVEFDPGAAVPVVPAPNDLAKDPLSGRLAVPSYATDSEAQFEFNKSYLNTLDGFPFESTATVRVTGDLNVASVTPANVLAIDVTDPSKPTPVADATPSYANKVLSISPPKGGWLRAHRYAIALYSGGGGLVGAKGEPVRGSATWALVSGTSPLVTCPDLKTNCRPAVDIIPSQKHDPAERLADQTASALRLEQVRLGYKPILDALTALGKPRETVPIVWTFSIVNAGEILFDPADGIIPFPNDVLRDSTAGKIKLPNPRTRQPLTAADCTGTDLGVLLVCGLNTLDGFSTTVPLISENSNELGALEQGTIDPKSLSVASVGLAKVKADAPTSVTDPKYTPCINCGSSDPAAKVQTLQWNFIAPLDERSTYLAYVTTDVKDDQGKNVVANPVFALVRSSKPLVAGGKSTVSILSDAQATQLEPLRAGMAPALDALAAKGVPREKVALAFAFTTQSEGSDLDKIRGIPAAATATAGLPDFPLVTANVTTAYNAAADAASIPRSKIGKFFAGAMLTPVAVTGPSGTLNPTGAKALPVQFVMSVPSDPAPTGGYPVTIFSHGLTRNRNDFMAIANSLATIGQVVIAIDTLYHGERTSCTGSLATIKAKVPSATSDDFACQDPTTMKCDEDPLLGQCVLRDDTKRPTCAVGPTGDGVCAAQGAGRCAADGKCQGVVSTTACTPGDGGNATCAAAGLGLCGSTTSVCTGSPARMGRNADGSVVLSGYNFFSTSNFFSTRDNFRQHVIDLEQLVRVLKSTASTNLAAQVALANGGAIALNTTKINYVGQSLGAILGTLFNAVSPDTTHVALNVGGGALSKLFLRSPDLAAQRAILISTLGAQGIQPGTPAFDQFIGSIQWILDPADPVNLGYRLTHGVNVNGVTAPNPNRKAFLQFIQDDQFVINESNLALVAGANRTFDPTPPKFGCVAPLFCYEFVDAAEGFNTTIAPLAGRHGFLLKPPSATPEGLAITSKAQSQVATFIATGAIP
jgi:hypothetical protein